MKKIIFPILFIVMLLAPITPSYSWGFWAHQRINRMAVFTLPPEMLGLYKRNIEYLTEHAVDPDKRRGAVEGEDAYHYMDVDHYGKIPFPEMPRYWAQAVEKYSEDTLRAYGIVPFHIPVMMNRLTKAFKDKDIDRIMKVSADMGHYIADAHVPLHTTENYNGQLTGQKGIHGFWESRLPELYAEQYNFYVGKANYIDDILLEPWDCVIESHHALDSVLRFEKKLTDSLPSDKKYGFENRNNITIRVYSREFSQAYHKMLSGMVERRMRKAISRVGSFWYTAWKDAGSPDLRELVKKTPQEVKDAEERRLKIINREDNSIGLRPCRPGSDYYFEHYITQEDYCSHRSHKKKELCME
ncbi:MAG: zinc dependent phospholipase C family protein [Bacteroidia bacterium]